MLVICPPTSAIASPAHGEVVKFLGKKSYNMRGWAYSGGGKEVTRVEVSFDQVCLG